MPNGKDENYLRPAGKPYVGKNKPARKKIRAVSKKKREQDKIYAKLRKELLEENPICQCWLQENGFFRVQNEYGIRYSKVGAASFGVFHGWSAGEMLASGAPPSESCHHTRGRGKYYLDKSTYLATSNHYHRWIEDHKDLAIEKGWLHPMKNRRPIELP